jgi:transposase
MRDGAEFFTEPTNAAQRRYEALRAYLVDQLSAAEVAKRFGYTTASVYQMATELRGGRMQFFAETTPGPKGPRKAGAVRDRVLALRAQRRSITEIATALTHEGTPVSAQTVWTILDAAGIGRLDQAAPPPHRTSRGPAHVASRPLSTWPHGIEIPCPHAGLLLLLPAMVDLDLPALLGRAGYPTGAALSCWQSVGSLLLAKAARATRVDHLDRLTDDAGLALALGLTALPGAAQLGSYYDLVDPESHRQLLAGVASALAGHGLATGTAGFTCDVRTIRNGMPLDRHHAGPRSRRTRAIRAFIAQDLASSDMIYATADLTRAEQARQIIAFVDHWRRSTGTDPGLLMFDSRLTSYAVLDELTERGLQWLTLRKRGQSMLNSLADLPAAAWSSPVDRPDHRASQVHDAVISIKGIADRVRQIAVHTIGRDKPVLLLTNAFAASAIDLFRRYVDRLSIRSKLDAHSFGLPVPVDLDTTLTVVAGVLLRMLARRLPRSETATPDWIWRHLLHATGTLAVTRQGVTVTLDPRTGLATVVNAGFAGLDLPIPWWDNRLLRFS